MSVFDEYKPMLLKEVNKPFSDENYIFEPKYDGVRALVHIKNGEVNIKTRNEKTVNDIFPELSGLGSITSDECVFDGEIISMDGDMPSFSKLQKRIHLKNKYEIDKLSKSEPVIFVCFDILYKNKDLTNLSLIQRKKILSRYKNNDLFVKTIYVLGDGVKLFESAKEMGLEGIVAKNINSVYQVGVRTHEWLKIKNWSENDFFVGGYYDNPNHVMATLAIGEISDKKLIYKAKVTIHKESDEYKKIKSIKKREKSPFLDFDDNRFIYVSKFLKCNIMYLSITSHGHLRHAVFKELN